MWIHKLVDRFFLFFFSELTVLTGVGGQCTRRGRPVQWRTRTHTHAPTHTQVGYCFLPKAQSSPGRSRRSAGARRKTGRRGESSRLEGNIVFEGRFCFFNKIKLRGAELRHLSHVIPPYRWRSRWPQMDCTRGRLGWVTERRAAAILEL